VGEDKTSPIFFQEVFMLPEYEDYK